MGDGPEVGLFGILKTEFSDDHITRVSKGVSGADIIHVVKHNGREAGRIVYDSKNRKDSMDVYATRVHDDQIEAKAGHAIPLDLEVSTGRPNR